jgi:plastocyanin
MRVLVVMTLAVAIAGCGGGSASSTEPANTPTTAPVVDVRMRENTFVPARIVVRRGELVRWTNDDKVAHTVASSKLKLASEAIRGGATFRYRPRKAGRFKYYCTIHFGQRGVLVVR